MRTASTPRWTIGFADLALLLLGSFVMLNALRPAAPVASASHAFEPAVELGAGDLFEPGEARLTAAGRERLASVARTADGRRVVLASRGVESGGERLDSFELAAARTAAVGRALGVDERDVSAWVERVDGEGRGQRISVRILR
jgi:hypothetical protein